MAGPTRLERATSSVTGRRSNQLSYEPLPELLYRIREQNASKLCYNTDIAVVAQLAEQLIRNEQVAGSIPVNGSILDRNPARDFLFVPR